MNKEGKPNILCFILDQLRFDHLGCAGNGEVSTPNIDALAKNGVYFDRAYVSNPLCMPARATLFTGLAPKAHGVRTNGIPLSRGIHTLPEALGRAGYRTHSIGKLHLRTFGMPDNAPRNEGSAFAYPESYELWNSGMIKSLPFPYYGLQSANFLNGHTSYVYGDYISWLEKADKEARVKLTPEGATTKPSGAPECYKMAIPEELHYNSWITERATDFLRKQKDSESPFFLWCSFPDPHHPYAAPEPWCDMYDPANLKMPLARREGELDDLPPFYRKIYESGGPLVSGLFGPSKTSDAHLREMVAQTYGMVSFTDREIGRIMRALRELGMEEETVVVFLTDHGDMMGDHWMIKKGPFQFDGCVRMPFIWSWPGRFMRGAVTGGIASQIDFVPTVLDICGVPMIEGDVPDKPEADMQPPPLAGRSLVPQLTGKKDRVNEWAIIENDEDYLGLRVRTFVTENYKMTIYAGEDYGELYELDSDPKELNNLWDEAGFARVRERLTAEFLNAYALQDNPLPRRLTHA